MQHAACMGRWKMCVILAGEPDRKSYLGNLDADGRTTYLRETGYEGVELIHLAQNRLQQCFC